MILILIVVILVILGLFFFANSVMSLIDHRKFYYSKVLVLLGLGSFFGMFILLMILTLANIELRNEIDKKPLRYKLINKPVYEQIK